MNKLFKKIELEVVFLTVLTANFFVNLKRQLHNFFRKSKDPLWDRLSQEYCEFNSRNMTPPSQSNSDKILIDCFPVPFWIIANSFLANSLAKKYEAEICSYGEIQRLRSVDRFYKSFFCNKHMIVRTPKIYKRRLKSLFLDAVKNIKSKKDLFEWSVGGVQVGDEVYETYLRMFNQPTVNIGSFKCRYAIFSALKYFLFFEEIFAKNNIPAVVLSHDIYISMGVLAKMAWKRGIPVYLSNSVELKKTTKPDEKYSEFRRYRKYFACLNRDEQISALDWARVQLGKRLGGDVGVNMAYSTKSAYVHKRIERQTSESKKTKVLIATHCFFDNPRAYGGMLFTDFYEWISYLGEISNITDYDWYIKTHRDFLPGTMEALKDLTNRYPKLKIINPETSWHQLSEEGVSVALTCYGSIGHELPLLGFKVINAGYNPHIAYDFNWHPNNKEEYSNILLNIELLEDIKSLDSIYEFYYVHYKMSKQGGFIFSSYDEMGDYCNNPGVLSNKIFEKLIKTDVSIIENAKQGIHNFIDSDKFSQVEKIIDLH